MTGSSPPARHPTCSCAHVRIHSTTRALIHSAATGAAKLIGLLDDEDTGALVTESGIVKAMLMGHVQDIEQSTDHVCLTRSSFVLLYAPLLQIALIDNTIT